MPFENALKLFLFYFSCKNIRHDITFDEIKIKYYEKRKEEGHVFFADFPKKSSMPYNMFSISFATFVKWTWLGHGMFSYEVLSK